MIAYFAQTKTNMTKVDFGKNKPTIINWLICDGK